MIDLETKVYEKFHHDKYEVQNPADFGIRKISIPCSDFFAPGRDQILQILYIIADCERYGEKVYIHCLHGKDRTGYVIACFRLFKCKFTPSEAIKEMYDHGFHKWPYWFFGWVYLLRRFYADVDYVDGIVKELKELL